jgi:riboflavin biosynthesis pyrimidine reductase
MNRTGQGNELAAIFTMLQKKQFRSCMVEGGKIPANSAKMSKNAVSAINYVTATAAK